MPRQSVVPGFRFDAKRKRATFEVTLPKTGGRVRRRKRIKAWTRDEALTLFRRFRDAVLADRAAEPPLFSDFVKRFWPLIRMRLGKKTAVNENSVVGKILVPFFGSYRLEKVNTALIRDFVALLRSRSYAAPTINGAVSVLLKILNDAVAREVIREFPAKGRLPKEKEPILRLEFSREEKMRFLDAFDDEPAFRRHFIEHCSAGRVVSSPHFGNAPRVFGGGLRPEGEALRYYFERFREMKPLFIVALETGLHSGPCKADHGNDSRDSRRVQDRPADAPGHTGQERNAGARGDDLAQAELTGGGRLGSTVVRRVDRHDGEG